MTKRTTIVRVAHELDGRRQRLFEEWREKALRPIDDYPPSPPDWDPGTAADHLDEVAEFVRRYVVVSPEQADAIALWAAHTHAFWAAEATPYLQITSAEKESGKTLLLEVLEQLVFKPWRAVSPTTAALFRKIEIDQPTLLLDEYDTIFDGRRKDTEGLRAVLNAGNRAGTTVPRAVGDGVRDYSVFCPKALVPRHLPASAPCLRRS